MERTVEPKLERTLISVGELCTTFGIGKTVAYELINKQVFRSIVIGRRRLIVWESVQDFVSSEAARGA